MGFGQVLVAGVTHNAMFSVQGELDPTRGELDPTRFDAVIGCNLPGHAERVLRVLRVLRVMRVMRVLRVVSHFEGEKRSKPARSRRRRT